MKRLTVKVKRRKEEWWQQYKTSELPPGFNDNLDSMIAHSVVPIVDPQSGSVIDNAFATRVDRNSFGRLVLTGFTIVPIQELATEPVYPHLEELAQAIERGNFEDEELSTTVVHSIADQVRRLKFIRDGRVVRERRGSPFIYDDDIPVSCNIDQMLYWSRTPNGHDFWRQVQRELWLR